MRHGVGHLFCSPVIAPCPRRRCACAPCGAPRARRYRLFVQGEAPREQLLRGFREDGDAVLLGTASFWEGVDVKGTALRLVIIEKLPFASPDDPIVKARVEHIQRQGGNPFKDYQLHEAALTLRQGVGRLIRSEADYGVVMIGDRRLTSQTLWPQAPGRAAADAARRLAGGGVAVPGTSCAPARGRGAVLRILALDTATEACSVALLLQDTAASCAAAGARVAARRGSFGAHSVAGAGRAGRRPH